MMHRRGRILPVLCGALCACGVMGCGEQPTGMPDPHTGSIRITAMDTLIVDSIFVGLDDIQQKKMRNPCTLTGILAGTHKLTLLDTAGARADTLVTIRRNELASLMLRLTRIGPFLGNEAPNFTARDIDNKNLELASMRGKVVFLVFFEHT